VNVECTDFTHWVDRVRFLETELRALEQRFPSPFRDITAGFQHHDIRAISRQCSELMEHVHATATKQEVRSGFSSGHASTELFRAQTTTGIGLEFVNLKNQLGDEFEEFAERVREQLRIFLSENNASIDGKLQAIVTRMEQNSVAIATEFQKLHNTNEAKFNLILQRLT